MTNNRIKASFTSWIEKVIISTSKNYMKKLQDIKEKEVAFVCEHLERVQLSEKDNGTLLNLGKTTLADEISDVELSKIIEELPEKQRDILEMTFHKNASSKEIAKELNLTVSNVDTIRSRTLDKIRKKYKKEDE